jgi:hypothetical protein
MRYFPNQLAAVKRNLAEHGIADDLVDIRVCSSEEAFGRAEHAKECFDFIIIDASHKVRAVMSDLRWARLLAVGGILCLHDYAPRFPGVRFAVNQFIRRNRMSHRIALAGSLIAFKKCASPRHPEVDWFDELYAKALHLPLKLWLNLCRRKKVWANH